MEAFSKEERVLRGVTVRQRAAAAAATVEVTGDDDA